MKKLTAILMAMVVLVCSGVFAVADSHNWDDGEWLQYPTCVSTGKKLLRCTDAGCNAVSTITVARTAHDFTAATCTTPATCKICGTVTGTVTAHAYLPATCTKLATCKHCGATTGTYKDHNFQNGKCTVCNKPQYALDDEPNEEDDLMVLAAQ